MPEPVKVEYPPYGKVSFREIAQIFKEQGKWGMFYYTRWDRAGRPDPITDDSIFLLDRTKKDVRKLGRSEFEAGRIKTMRCADYDNRSYLPHIKKGDLAHLSDKVNTGAARKGCEEWDRLNPKGPRRAAVGYGGR